MSLLRIMLVTSATGTLDVSAPAAIILGSVSLG